MKIEEHLKIYSAVVKKAGIELKGKNMLYTSANGYMFSQLNKDGEIGIRLSKEDTLDFDSKYGAEPFKSYGATMREYVLIPEDLLTDIDAMAYYLKKGHEHVISLPPK
ncbi:hypothetical protein MTsPCn9_30170 [Croceitalea sp. MTPC9]|uniref:hypothetical protein n=1 Tax=unclassified Croceitalea TaxID=2632280 RepID=UPI002B3F594E|nr:hypothetical protein MTsPCn6_21480 [Croceitalea sp. MTPC6]GMN18077.1 hypothetical protein MTsPCn9_30170 [Croceitalea sp. MTPC9]